MEITIWIVLCVVIQFVALTFVNHAVLSIFLVN